jgi:hypothetical protein
MIDIRFDISDLAGIGENLQRIEDWAPQFIDSNMEQLGRRIAYLMQQQVEPNYYTGSLSDSIVSDYDPGARRLEIGPTVKRGRWDGGLILQRGTGPIPNAPWFPIKEWAEYRGIPAFPVWYKIRTEGVDAHPFLEETLQRGDVQVALAHTAGRIGMHFVAYGLQKFGSAQITTGDVEEFGL